MDCCTVPEYKYTADVTSKWLYIKTWVISFLYYTLHNLFEKAPGAEYNNYFLGLDAQVPWHISTYKWSEYETNFRLMWSFHRGQLYNRLHYYYYNHYYYYYYYLLPVFRPCAAAAAAGPGCSDYSWISSSQPSQIETIEFCFDPHERH